MPDRIGSLFRRLSARCRTSRRPSWRSCRPGVEALEDRLVPAVSVLDTPTAVTFTVDDAGNTLVVRVTGPSIEYSANGAAFVALPNARPDLVVSFVARGGAGNDTIDLSPIGDRLTALAALGKGAQMFGGSGNDTLTGTDLNDPLDGGAGIDPLRGGKGDDAIQAIDGQVDTLDGGLGRDSAWFESVD